MRKLFFILFSSLILFGCDGVKEGLIDPNEEMFLVDNIVAPTTVAFIGENTKIETEITLSEIESLNKIWFELSSEDNVVSIANVDMVNINAEKPNLFFGTTKMKEDNPTGNYVIEYFVNTLLQEGKKIASHMVFYDNLREVKLESIDAPNKFVYSEKNKDLITSISFSNAYSLRNVWFSVQSVSSGNVLSDSVKMGLTPDGSPFSISVYKDSLKMNSTYLNGNYVINYFISTESNSKIKIASHEFLFESNGTNSSPVISNPLFYYIDEEPTLRDTLENNKEFILSIEVNDENGLSDIDSVYTDFYSPNNPSAYRVILFDDGKEENGDKIAGDGIYSWKNIFQGAQGNRKFEFWARDRAGELSNMISHNLVIK